MVAHDHKDRQIPIKVLAEILAHPPIFSGVP
jgi:hypothetical protein